MTRPLAVLTRDERHALAIARGTITPVGEMTPFGDAVATLIRTVERLASELEAQPAEEPKPSEPATPDEGGPLPLPLHAPAISGVSTAPIVDSSPVEDIAVVWGRLKKSIDALKPAGGCRLVSIGDACACPLCDADRMGNLIRTQQAQLDEEHETDRTLLGALITATLCRLPQEVLGDREWDSYRDEHLQGWLGEERAFGGWLSRRITAVLSKLTKERDEARAQLAAVIPLRPGGLRPLTPEEHATLDAFTRHMGEDVIPEVIRIMQARAERAAEIRGRPLTSRPEEGARCTTP